MDGVDVVLARDGNQRFDIQVRAHRLAALNRADEKRFVSFEAVQREAILVAVNRDGPQTELGGGAEAADGDLGAVGDQQFAHTQTEESSDLSVCSATDIPVAWSSRRVDLISDSRGVRFAP